MAMLAAASATLADVRAKLERANRSRVSVEAALATERDRAVEAERQASDLRELIAKDAGTARDGATAPVLLDVLRTMRGPK